MAENIPLKNLNAAERNSMDAQEVPLVKKMTAELIGTFLLTFAILASVQNMKLIGDGNGGDGNDFWLVCVTHGLVLGMVAWIYGPFSGGHVNPAVSFAFLLKRKLNIVEFSIYVAAQLAGSFLAAIVVSGLFHVNFVNCVDSCCGLCNEPVTGLHTAAAFFVEVIGTFILILAVLATADDNNKSLASPIAKVTLIAFAIILAGTTVGKLTGFAINPARDLMPRFWAAAFYGKGALTAYTWVPVVGPMVGAALAVGVKELH